jgi:beta-xylosidase/lysophospholipase L1-like esterase
MSNKPLYKSAPDPVTGEMIPDVWVERGWGQLLPEFFGEGLVIDNMAKNGSSTRSFIAEKRWERLVDKIQPGDYVVIQFGHNDAPVEKKNHTSPEAYRGNLERFVSDVKSQGGCPILCTPVPRRTFDDRGNFLDSHGEYVDIVRRVARERAIPLVDLYEATKKMIIEAGKQRSVNYFRHIAAGTNRNFPEGLIDNTHFVETGARAVAALFVEEIKRQNMAPLVSLLKEHAPRYRSRAWVADLENGRYKNPVLYADYSDPDVCRVGDDFYMTSSSFNCVPGLPILHSNDLVNWTLVGHAIARQLPEAFFDTPRHGCGVWAPSIRHHDGTFYIYYGDPDQGIFMTQTRDPRGRWSDPGLVKAGKGLIDPCPLWDDDGQLYLVHAFAGSRAGIKSLLAVTALTPDGRQAVGHSRIVYDGHDRDVTIEGPKFYKRDDYYYIFAPAGGVKEGWQVVLRSKNLFGPYERRVVLASGSSGVNGPHQGAWVDTRGGEEWFIHFQDLAAYGRVVHLQPVTWQEGWPVVGEDKDGDGIGEPVSSWKKPAVGKRYPVATPVESDEFSTGTLGLQWQWHANPREWWYFLDVARGCLSLYSVPLPDGYKNLWDLPNLLLQKLPARAFTATARLTFVPNRGIRGERAGLVMMGMDYALLAIESTPTGFLLSQRACIGANKEGDERVNASVELSHPTVYARVRVKEDATCAFSYSVDGKKFISIGSSFKMKEGQWIGAKFGLFCSRPATGNDGGRVDVEWVHVDK